MYRWSRIDPLSGLGRVAECTGRLAGGTRVAIREQPTNDHIGNGRIGECTCIIDRRRVEGSRTSNRQWLSDEHVVKSFFRLRIANEKQLRSMRQPAVRIWIAVHCPAVKHGDHVASRVAANVALGQRASLQRCWGRQAEDVQPLGHQQDIGTLEQVEQTGCPDRSLRQHAVGPGSVQRRHVSLQIRAGKDLDAGSKLSAIERQEDVYVIVMRHRHAS